MSLGYPVVRRPGVGVGVVLQQQASVDRVAATNRL